MSRFPSPLALAALLLPPLAPAQQPPPASRPHIVVFLADDLGWNDVGYHGGEIRTPNIDELATQGVRLEQFYVQPVCSPTRAAFLTGRYPIRTGLQVGVIRPSATHGLPTDERTLADALRDSGYVTAICGKWHLGLMKREFLPTARGFDHQYGHYCGAIDYFEHARNGGKDWNRDDKPLDERGYTTDLIARESVRLIENHQEDKPLFLYVAFNAPHTPLQAPQRYIDMYASIERPKRRRFAAMVTCMDDAIGRVVAAIDKRGWRNSTLFFFTSDNGGAANADNSPLRAGKGRLYEGGVRAPAVICWPGKLAAGAVVKKPLHIVDLLPTFARLAGASLEGCKPLDGKDAWPAIAEGKPSPHEEILLNVAPTTGALRAGDWKIVWNGRRRGNRRRNAQAGPSWELFDLSKDPGEKSDLSRRHPEVLARLKERLERFAKEAKTPARSPARRPPQFRVPQRWGHADAKPGK